MPIVGQDQLWQFPHPAPVADRSNRIANHAKIVPRSGHCLDAKTGVLSESETVFRPALSVTQQVLDEQSCTFAARSLQRVALSLEHVFSGQLAFLDEHDKRCRFAGEFDGVLQTCGEPSNRFQRCKNSLIWILGMLARHKDGADRVYP